MKKIGIVILHYGSMSVTKTCVVSILRKESLFSRIIIVNNTNMSLPKEDFREENIVIINNKKNLGFSGGMNVGIKYALKENMDAVMLLNNDTKIEKGFLKKLISALDLDESIGIISPAIQFSRNGKAIFDIGGKINKFFWRTSHDEVVSLQNLHLKDVDYVTGAATLIKKEVFKRTGLLDEHFFLYYEDVDFCLRAKEKDFRVVVEPKAVIFHSLSKTVGKVSPFAVYYQTRSALIFGRKHIPHLPSKFFHMAFLINQTALITFKYPNTSIAALKAFFNFPLE